MSPPPKSKGNPLSPSLCTMSALAFSVRAPVTARASVKSPGLSSRRANQVTPHRGCPRDTKRSQSQILGPTTIFSHLPSFPKKDFLTLVFAPPRLWTYGGSVAATWNQVRAVSSSMSSSPLLWCRRRARCGTACSHRRAGSRVLGAYFYDPPGRPTDGPESFHSLSIRAYRHFITSPVFIKDPTKNLTP